MNKNFEIGQSNEIIKSGKVYDLHNLYSFIGLYLEVKYRRLQLLFEPDLEYGQNQLPITINFEKIDYLQLSSNFGATVITGLDEIGYKSPGDYDDNWLMTEQQAFSNDHLFLRMVNGDFIRIHCQNATLIESSLRNI